MQVGAGSESDNTLGSKIRDTIKSGYLILRGLGEHYEIIDVYIGQGKTLKPRLILLLIISAVMFKMRTLALENKGLEASKIKTCELVHKYIDGMYFELIKFHNKIFNTLKLIFENVVRNRLKSHKKDKKTVFDILGVCYKLT